MSFNKNVLFAALSLAFSASVYAQTAGTEIQRDVNQQERIEQGLKSGELNTKETSKLEKGESKIDRMEQKAMSDGKLSPEEKARIGRAQNKESSEIYKLKHNDRTGNPNSASSKRMQEDVQRNVNQETRIEQGVKSGSLTKREAGRLEGQQARVDRSEAPAGADGHVGRAEQHRIQHKENRGSKKIYRGKHDAQHN